MISMEFTKECWYFSHPLIGHVVITLSKTSGLHKLPETRGKRCIGWYGRNLVTKTKVLVMPSIVCRIHIDFCPKGCRMARHCLKHGVTTHGNLNGPCCIIVLGHSKATKRPQIRKRARSVKQTMMMVKMNQVTKKVGSPSMML